MDNLGNKSERKVVNMNNQMNDNKNGGNNQPPRRPSPMMLVLAALSTVLIVFAFYTLLFGTGDNNNVKEYTEFLKDLEADRVEAVQVNMESGEIQVTLKLAAVLNTKDTFGADGEQSTGQPGSLNDSITGGQSNSSAGEPELNGASVWGLLAAQQNRNYTTLMMEGADKLTERLEAHDVSAKRIVSNSLFTEILISVVLPVLLVWLLLGFLFRRMGGSGGPMGVGKSNAKVYVQKETGVTFKDVAGEDEAKESLVEVVDFLHNPGKYSRIGAKLPKGALLVGPPGTGKTLLARAVAGEAHVPFFSLTGSDFIELYVGVGASRVRDLFKEATKNAPCIVFIDEIDAIGRSRDSKYGGGNEEREQTLNQLLSEMDGFDSSKGILILAATNRPEILDKALLRPGRFDRRIIVDKPDLKGRVEILKVHSKDVKMDETVDLDAIALATSGAVGSDLANMINEAAINAVKEGREYVNQQDLFTAVEQVLVGKEKKDRIMSKEERKIVSYHEVGHALISALQKNSEPVQKITIVPRTMGALGYVMHVPEEEKYLNTEAELRDMLVGLVGGRAAEEVVFDTVTTGAANDIERATEIARSMVTRYGMSKKFGLVGLATIESQYLEGRAALNCSDETAAEIDAEVVAIIRESYEKALELLRENREIMDKLAAFLIEKETITGKEFMEIFRREKGLPDPEEEKKAEKKDSDKDGSEKKEAQNAESIKGETAGTERDTAADVEANAQSSAEGKGDNADTGVDARDAGADGNAGPQGLSGGSNGGSDTDSGSPLGKFSHGRID